MTTGETSDITITQGRFLDRVGCAFVILNTKTNNTYCYNVGQTLLNNPQSFPKHVKVSGSGSLIIDYYFTNLHVMTCNGH